MEALSIRPRFPISTGVPVAFASPHRVADHIALLRDAARRLFPIGSPPPKWPSRGLAHLERPAIDPLFAFPDSTAAVTENADDVDDFIIPSDPIVNYQQALRHRSADPDLKWGDIATLWTELLDPQPQHQILRLLRLIKDQTRLDILAQLTDTAVVLLSNVAELTAFETWLATDGHEWRHQRVVGLSAVAEIASRISVKDADAFFEMILADGDPSDLAVKIAAQRLRNINVAPTRRSRSLGCSPAFDGDLGGQS